MRPLSLAHPAAWGGLLLHGMFVVLMYMAKNMPREGLSPEETILLEMLVAAIPFLLGVIAVQILSLWGVLSGSRVGLIAAIVSGCAMLPVGLIYIMGCLLTWHAVRFAAFERAGAATGRAFPAALKTPMQGIAAVCLFGALLSPVLGLTLFIGFFLVGGFLALYLVVRLLANPPLALGRDGVVVTPGLLADRLFLPYAAMRRATLFADQSIRFVMQTPEGVQELAWPPASVRADSRREAFEGLAAALQAASVPMD